MTENRNEEHFDAVVVGSGFGGAVMTYRLAKAGIRVCLLERGNKYPPGSFPRKPYEMKDNFWDPSEGLYGMFNFWSFRGLEVLIASGLGGGSLIYSNVLIRKPEEWFLGWPITRKDLDPHYNQVERMLKAQPYPYNDTPKTKALESAARGLCLPSFRPNLAVTFGEPPAPGKPIEESNNIHGQMLRYTCNLCGECTLGCNNGSKNTLDLNYLTEAKRHGAEIRTLSKVKTFTPRKRGGYDVNYVKRDPEGEVKETEITITTDRLILAAGSLGTTFLLLKNMEYFRNISKKLGTRFSTNGDLVTFAVRSKKYILDPSYGPVITTAIQPKGNHGFYIEDGGYPNFVNWMLELGNVPGVIRRLLRFIWVIFERWWYKVPKSNWSAEIARLLGESELSSRSLPLLGMGLDSPEGTMKLNKGYLDIEWPNRRSREYFDRLRETMRRITEQLQADFNEKPIRYLKKRVITVHPLGGCPMGKDKNDGVVDSYGEVFGYKGLYIADGSVMPGPVGTNPALTIAALANRLAERIIDP